MSERYSVIVDAVRSPIGLKNGEMIGMRPDDITAQVVKALMARNPAVKADEVEDLVLGCAFPEGIQGMLMGRGVALLAGLPNTTTGSTVNRFCGSSMDALHQLSTSIMAGDKEIGIAAGVEDMFGVPMGGYNPDFNPELYEIDYYMGMGETAENLAQELEIGRDDQEAFAIASHQKALAAQAAGRFDNEIVPIEIEGIRVSKDEGPREPDVAKIKSLSPAFLEEGTITAATSSPISVGAAAVLVMSNTKAEELGLKVRAKIISRAVAGVDPTHMGSGPLPATEKALKNVGMTLDQMDTIELNEAFGAQSLYVIRKGNWPSEKINLNGGAIALGHPLGCSGARIVTTLLNVMEQNDTKFGLATMCIGTGQGIATIIERN
ncbi:MAG: thiolase family protein [FCB group bacterium]|nr:thiolase family protein [FCB group bacterium]MBL7027105.1 thiolase family protein [Candidatus Neomarinimicrobiota bacterium]MBL7122419.1 thiolase family protein [Candidatus Neomarinimicrobiota bacterium]